MPDSGTWRLRPGQALAYRQWDGEYVLYNNLSGDTHLLGEAAIELLLALRNGPAAREALAAALQAQFDFGDADPLGETDELLLRLKSLALVERFAC